MTAWGAVAADLEAAEPVRPPVVEDAVDADLVPGGPPQAVHTCSPPRLAASARPIPCRNVVASDVADPPPEGGATVSSSLGVIHLLMAHLQ
jgi:hypothetical protein